MAHKTTHIDGIHFTMEELLRFKALLNGGDYLTTFSKVIDEWMKDYTSAALFKNGTNDDIREARGACKIIDLIRDMPKTVDIVIDNFRSDIAEENTLTPDNTI